MTEILRRQSALGAFCRRLLLCKSIAKEEMRHFPAPSGQPKGMRKSFMRCTLAVFRGVLSRLKLYDHSETECTSLKCRMTAEKAVKKP